MYKRDFYKRLQVILIKDTKMNRIISLLLLFFVSMLLPAQINQYKKKFRHGLWITYHDEAKTKIYSKGRYNVGIQKGKWEFYNEDGACIKKERYKRKKIKVRLFYPTGQLQKKGSAKLELADSLYHYYFTGEWKCYNTKGELEKKEYYEKGQMINDVLYKTSEMPMFNDSLAKQLKSLYNAFYRYSDSVTYVKRNFGTQTAQYKRMMKLDRENDSLIKEGIARIVAKFNYPTKEQVGAEYTTLFFLISSYDQLTKENYYELIVGASEKGVLNKKDVSFFIDKVKVGRKEPQVYCTQFKIEKDKIKYYPVSEMEKLNDRRSSVGLEPLEINKLLFTAY